MRGTGGGRPGSAPAASDQVALGAELAERLHQAQDRLLARPHVSIGLRFLLSLLLCFCLYVITAGFTVDLLRRERGELRFLRSAELLSFHVQQARRFEKDFLLYGTNLDDARDHVVQVETLLSWETSHARAPVSPNLAALERNVEAYASFLDRCRSLPAQAPQDTSLRKTLEAGLREHGAEMTRLAEGLTDSRQARVEHALRLAETTHVVLVGALFLFFLVMAYLFLHALTDPLKRFQAYMRRIAQGDFSLIAPARRYRDEFSDLAVAVNRMLAELQANQERCLRTGQLATVGTITSGIAHELNNPLNNVSLTLESLTERFDRLSEERRWKLLQDAYFETERMGEIVKSLLDFTRQERPELVPLDLGEIVQSTQKLVQNEMALHEVAFDFAIPSGFPRIRGVANQLRQVFLNLFINAVQAMPEGGRLTVRARVLSEEMLCVDVCDTGAGIPASVLPNLFVPFFTTKEPGKGTGLGLSVSYSIIKKHGGDIRVSSEPGKGATFHVCLPLQPEEVPVHDG
jgi:two-component system NtrC family sensor kinase